MAATLSASSGLRGIGYTFALVGVHPWLINPQYNY
jgi:hypothetical protein